MASNNATIITTITTTTTSMTTTVLTGKPRVSSSGGGLGGVSQFPAKKRNVKQRIRRHATPTVSTTTPHDQLVSSVTRGRQLFATLTQSHRPQSSSSLSSSSSSAHYDFLGFEHNSNSDNEDSEKSGVHCEDMHMTTRDDTTNDDNDDSTTTRPQQQQQQYSNTKFDEMYAKIQRFLSAQWSERLRQQLMSEEQRRRSIVKPSRLEISSKTLLRIRNSARVVNANEKCKQPTIKDNNRVSDSACRKHSKHKNGGASARKRVSVSSSSRGGGNGAVNGSTSSGNPGFITCTICSATKYYSHVQRRYGVFSCEPCSKFFARFIRDPKLLFCGSSGDCPIASSSSSVSVSDRCKACWLKLCLQKFVISSDTRARLTSRFSPKLADQPHVALITIDTQCGTTTTTTAHTTQPNNTSTQTTKDESKWSTLLMLASDATTTSTDTPRGPRVKRVCRSQAAAYPRPSRALVEQTWSPRVAPEVMDASPQAQASDGSVPSLVSAQPSGHPFVVTCSGWGAEPNLFQSMKWMDDTRQQEIVARDAQQSDVSVEAVSSGVLLLHFTRPRVDDSGQYTCSATFQHSDVLSNSVNITFFRDITFEDCSSDQFVIDGVNDERIRCKASANPKPSIMWTKDGHALTDTSRYAIDTEGVRIKQPSSGLDAGRYHVRALVTETGRRADKWISVRVFVRPKIDLERSSRVVDAIADESLTLQCFVGDDVIPPPLWSWFDTRQRNLSSVSGYAVNRDTGQLIVSRVRLPDDRGNLSCVAENSVGSDRKIVSVNVIVKPVVTSFLNQSFDMSSVSYLECYGTGEPRPQLSIRKDGLSRPYIVGDPRVAIEERVSADNEAVIRLTLVNTEKSDAGLYYCRATNAGGSAERVGHLEVRFAPDLSKTPLTHVKTWDNKRVNITCVAEAIPNATIKWWFRGQELKQEYLNADIYRIMDGEVTGVSHLSVNGVQNRDIYGVYRCEAINPLGSKDMNIELELAYKPGPLTHITHDRITPTTITFRLTGPQYDGGVLVKSVHAQYREHNMAWTTATSREWPVTRLNSLDASHGPYLIDQLLPNRQYVFRFATLNEVGVSDWSVDKLVTTARETRPDPPLFHNLPISANNEELVSNHGNMFVVTWTPPPDNGRPIKYYRLEWRRVRRSTDGFQAMDTHSASATVSSNAHPSTTLNNLVPDSLYTLELYAVSDLGSSDPSRLVFRTGTTSSEEGSNGGLVGEHEQSGVASRASLVVGVVAGVVCAVVLLLVVTDVLFYFRKVGVIYFLSQHVCTHSTRRKHSSAQNSKHQNMLDPMATRSLMTTTTKQRFNDNANTTTV